MRRLAQLVWLAFLGSAPACAAGGGGTAPAAIALPGCVPPPELAAALVEPAAVGRRCGSDPVCWRLAVAEARALRDRFPGEYDAHRSYVLTARAAARHVGAEAAAAVESEYEALAAAHPGNPAYPHLVAQLALEGEAYAARLADLASTYPDYPWAQLSLALRGRPESPPKARAAAGRALARFVAICPDRTLEASRALDTAGDAALWGEVGPGLRRRAVERGDLPTLVALWQLARRFTDEAALASQHAEMVAELDELTARTLPDDLGALATLAETAEAIGATTALGRAVDRLIERFPCTAEARRYVSQRYWDTYPELTATGDEGQAAPAEARALVERLLAACPGDSWALARKVEGMRWGPAEWTAELFAAADALAASGAGSGAMPPAPELWLAELYLDRGARLERVPELLARAAAAPDATEPQARRTRLRLAARYALAVGDAALARERLTELEAAIATGGAAAAGEGSSLSVGEERWLDRLRAALDRAEGRPEAALDRLAPWLAELPETSPLEPEARTAWVAARGGDAGYAEWRRELSRLAGTTTPWRRVDEPLPAVAWTDLSGERFDPAALLGKTVVLRFWATWCPACRAELPALARLAERFAGRADVVLLLADVDREPGALVPYLASGAVPWDPVFAGHASLGREIERVPATWIVDGRGRIVRRQEGPAADRDGWIEAAAREIESVAASVPAAAR